MRKLKNTTLLRNNGTLLFDLQYNALVSLVHLHIALEAGEEVAMHCIGGHIGGRHHSRVVFLSFLIPALLLSFLQVQTLLEIKFFSGTVFP